MIDLEAEVFSTIANILRKQFKDIFVTGEYVSAPSSFPAVSIMEEDNYTNIRTLTQESTENHAFLMYEVNVYSNKESGKKSEAKKILNVIDSEFQRLGFIRKSSTAVPNLNDATIYRIVARYTATVSKEKIIYR